MAGKRIQPKSGAGARLCVSRKALRTVEPPISDLMARAIQTPGLISFAAGLVDEGTLPVEAAGRICRRLLARPEIARAALQYGTTLGLRPLREQLLKHIEGLEGKSARRMGFSADQILLTTGSQQVLYLIGDVLLDEGDIVIAANPSYFVFTGTLASLGARIIGVPMDEQGMQVEEVECLLADLQRRGELGRVKFVYCTSYYQNPTGLTLSLQRRKRLLEIVQRYSREHRILIVEDAAYRELQYDGKRLPSIKSFDAANEYTVLTQTFSKPFAPGLKLGYTVMPQDLLTAVLRQKGNHDFGSANLCQWIALEAMQSGMYARHVAKLCRHYQNKRDAMLRALEQYMPKGVTWTHPAGGLYVWLTLPSGIRTGPGEGLFEKAVESGVLYVPGEYAFGGEAPQNHLRLCFGQVPMSKIKDGVGRLGKAMEQVIQGDATEGR